MVLVPFHTAARNPSLENSYFRLLAWNTANPSDADMMRHVSRYSCLLQGCMHVISRYVLARLAVPSLRSGAKREIGAQPITGNPTIDGYPSSVVLLCKAANLITLAGGIVSHGSDMGLVGASDEVLRHFDACRNPLMFRC